jgi:hypothetical protein
MSASDFISQFHPHDETHVRWYMNMIRMAENYTNENITMEVNTNPMGLKIKDGEFMSWPQIHCLLGAKYSKSVLSHTAWIPPSKE